MSEKKTNSSALKLRIEIEPDDLDGGYIAAVVGLPGCRSQGDTVGDALRNIAEAYEGVRDTLMALDRDLIARSYGAIVEEMKPDADE